MASMAAACTGMLGTAPVARRLEHRRPRRRYTPTGTTDGRRGGMLGAGKGCRDRAPGADAFGARRTPRPAASWPAYLAWCAADFVANALCRGVGQVAFANNPMSGAAIMLALCLPLPPAYALLGVLGLVASTATALALGLGNTAINNGLYGFNGVLVGQAAATFLVLDTAAQVCSAALAVALFAVLAGLLSHGLGNMLIEHHKVPPFTLPFNIATLVLLMCARAQPDATGLTLQPFLAPAALSVRTAVAPSYGDELGVDGIVSAVFSGVSQIWLCDHIGSGIAIVAAMAVFSRVVAAMAVVGSATGMATAMLLAVPAASIKAGLWGYNGCLSAIAVGGMFYLLSWRTVLLAVVTAAVATATQNALASAFQPYGMPVMTLPFCLATLLAVLLRVFQPISLATMTTPEEHITRARQLLRQKHDAIKGTLGRFADLHVGFLAAVADYEEGQQGVSTSRHYLDNRATTPTSAGSKSRALLSRAWSLAHSPTAGTTSPDFSMFVGAGVGGTAPSRGRDQPLAMPASLALLLVRGQAAFVRNDRRSATAFDRSLGGSTASANVTPGGYSMTRHHRTPRAGPSPFGAVVAGPADTVVEHGPNDGAVSGGKEHDLQAAALPGARHGIAFPRSPPRRGRHQSRSRLPPGTTGRPGQVAGSEATVTTAIGPGSPTVSGQVIIGIDGIAQPPHTHGHAADVVGAPRAPPAATRAPSPALGFGAEPPTRPVSASHEAGLSGLTPTLRGRVGQSGQGRRRGRGVTGVVTFRALATGVGLPGGVDGRKLVECLLAPAMGSVASVVRRATMRKGLRRREQTGYGHFTGSLRRARTTRHADV